jgi:HK97 family phage major capsid protein
MDRIPIYLAALIVAIAGSPLDIYDVHNRGLGTEKAEPWRVKVSTCVPRLTSALRAIGAFLWPHRQALAVTALLCVSLFVAPAHANGLPLIGMAGILNDQLFFEPRTDGSLQQKGTVKGAGIKYLRAAKADLHAYLSGLNERIVAGKRQMTESERAAATDVKDFARQVDLELAVAQRLTDQERAATAVADPDDMAAIRAGRGVPGLSRPGDLSTASRPSGPRWAQMFGHPAPSQIDEAEFLTALFSGRHDPRLVMQAATMTSGDNPMGIVVPDQMAGAWLDSGLASELVRPRAQVWGMTSATRTVPAWDLSDRSAGAIAGLTMVWMIEGVDQVPQVAKPRGIKLHAKIGAIFCEASNPLVADGLDFSAQLGTVMTLATAYGMDKAFLFGTGVGSPLGIFNSAARIAVTRTGAGLIQYEDLTAMFARMVPASVTKAVWVAHPSTIPQLTSLSVQIGAGGALIPVMTSADGSFNILTRPVIFSELAKPLGTPGDIGLFDFGEYVVGMRKEVSIDTSNAPGWTRDALSFRVIVRLDGQPAAAAPITPDNGAPTMSSFVTLA